MTESRLYKGYTVFNDGRVIGIKNTFLKPGVSSNGYYTVVTCFEGKKTSELIHRMVAALFIPNPENKRTVNHKNGIKVDNRVENLEWATDKENITHAFRTGLNDRAAIACSITMSKKVIDTSNGKQYPSAIAAAKSIGINHNTLRSYLIGKRENKTTLKYYEHI